MCCLMVGAAVKTGVRQFFDVESWRDRDRERDLDAGKSFLTRTRRV